MLGVTTALLSPPLEGRNRWSPLAHSAQPIPAEQTPRAPPPGYPSQPLVPVIVVMRFVGCFRAMPIAAVSLSLVEFCASVVIA